MSNPFATKYWSSGVIPFQFSGQGENLETLQEQIRRQPICQIIGPHGSGKSTLLVSLLKQYEKEGKKVRSLFFNDQHRRIPEDIAFSKDQILFVDGFEQLRLRDRLGLLSRSKRLILTVHRPVWFVPILYRTKPQLSVFVQIVRQRIAPIPDDSILLGVYSRSSGNFRSAFFELYDQWEAGLLSEESEHKEQGHTPRFSGSDSIS